VSAIEWLHRPGTTAEAWNPVTGCTKVSAGCKHCYAETIAGRFWAKQYGRVLPSGGNVNTVPTTTFEDYEREGLLRTRRFTDVWTHRERLSDPLSWRKARTVFVNSMSDLFHEAVPDEFIDRIFATMALSPRHTFIVLTKRPERMRAYMTQLGKSADRLEAGARSVGWTTRFRGVDGRENSTVPWPLPNVWLGVSVEDQATADARIPLLLKTPAAVRVVSAEPLLGPLDLSIYMASGYEEPPLDDIVSWLIVGGESGPKARPCDVDWVRALVTQAKAADVPVFVKQLGANTRDRNDVGFEGDKPGGWPADTRADDCLGGPRFQGDPVRVRFRARKGADPSEWPANLRVREWPHPRSGSTT